MKLAAVAVLCLALVVGGRALLFQEDDVPVDPEHPGAQRAIAEALEVVPGRFVEVARDRDNGKWEVIVAHDGGEYEVELAPATFHLLRLDYD